MRSAYLTFLLKPLPKHVITVISTGNAPAKLTIVNHISTIEFGQRILSIAKFLLKSLEIYNNQKLRLKNVRTP